MRSTALFVAAFLTSLALCGCSKQDPAAPAADKDEAKAKAKPEPKREPTGYIDTLVSRPDAVKQKLYGPAVQQSIDAFNILKGRYPKSLEELKQDGYEIPALPKRMVYKYDAKKGKVEIVEE